MVLGKSTKPMRDRGYVGRPWAIAEEMALNGRDTLGPAPLGQADDGNANLGQAVLANSTI